MIHTLIIIVFVLGYLAIACEHVIRINKTASALLTAVACWLLLAYQQTGMQETGHSQLSESLAHGFQDITQIVFFLIGAMTIVQTMEVHGGFQFVADLIKTSNKRVLLWTMSFVTFILSAILDNLTTSIVMVSLLQRLIDDKEDRMIYAAMIIIAANSGGAWSPIGDVTTTMLWIGGKVSTVGIIKALIIPSLVSMLLPLAFFTTQLKKGSVASAEIRPQELEARGREVFWLGLGALIFVPVFKILTGLPPFLGMLLGVGVLWFVTDIWHMNGREHLMIPRMISKIDFSSVLFFLGILLAVSALETAGILTEASSALHNFFQNNDIIIALLGIISAIVDNVPLTAAAMGMYDMNLYPMDHRLWEMLAFAVGTGGSILIIGSAAGVVVMGIEKITFGWYLKRVSLPALVGYLAGIGTYVLFAAKA